ncbi:aldo/keto reductase [Desulfosporosinus sp. PR]|uniref:aldo/keto reductase n=1 Tax=Candidatus Desulfosporosinus nitrosoreducens TaxID=3401928 RepID=UPI0027E8FAB9|nr:aldo/keto reductase [Desulfosporosinus sp. PR]MDQ7092822.1 aldo/keto reductase [Desulfosporosinus sp. PR]
MRYLTLKGHGLDLKVSKLAMGTDKLMLSLTDEEFFYLLDTYTDAGGNFIDTARVYSGGKSEEAIGRWLKKTGKRGNIVLSSKGCHPPRENMAQSRLAREDMAYDLELSLKALETDCLDIYWLHRDDPAIPAGEIVEHINSFIQEGKIRMAGCSNWRSDRIEEANQYAAQKGLSGFSSSQIQWSLAHTSEDIYQDYGIVIMDEKEYDYYCRKNLPVLAYASQAQGFFSKVAKDGLEVLSEKTRKRFASEDNLKRLETLQDFAAKHGISLAAASLVYITCNRLPAVPIIGSRTPRQLQESLEAADILITPEEADKLYVIAQ